MADRPISKQSGDESPDLLKRGGKEQSTTGDKREFTQRKDAVTYRREDFPPEMSSYLNRYYRGRIAVGWEGDYLKLRSWAPHLNWLRDELPAPYFSL